MDFGPPVVSQCIDEHPLKDMARDAQLVWELSHQCDALLAEKRQLVDHCREVDEAQDERELRTGHAEANLVAVNEHFRLKIIGLMADVAHLEEERAEWNAWKSQATVTNDELRTALVESVQEKSLADETVVLLKKQVEQQLHAQMESSALNNHLAQQLAALESRWQGVTDQWYKEKMDLVNLSAESRDSDAHELERLRRAYAAAENHIDTLKEKANEVISSSEKLRLERDALSTKTATWADELSDMQSLLGRKKAENIDLSDEVRTLQRQIFDSESSGKAYERKNLTELQCLTAQLHEEKEKWKRKIVDYETEKNESEAACDRQMTELRRVSTQRSSLERVNLELEKQLMVVKQSFAKLEESLRRQSAQYETETIETERRLTLREDSMGELQEELTKANKGLAIPLVEVATQACEDPPVQLSDFLRVRGEVDAVRADLAISEIQRAEAAKRLESLAIEKKEAERKLESIDALFEQLKQMREWRVFESQHLSPSEQPAAFVDQTRLILKFLEYQVNESTQLQHNVDTSAARNTQLAETVITLQGRLSDVTSTRQAFQESARRRANKLRQIKETILQWADEHSLNSSFPQEMIQALTLNDAD